MLKLNKGGSEKPLDSAICKHIYWNISLFFHFSRNTEKGHIQNPIKGIQWTRPARSAQLYTPIKPQIKIKTLNLLQFL